jgi:UDP-glucose 4-epimerase
MKKIVIFGGAGFLGSHTADALTRNGYEVTIFDIRKSPYLVENQKMIVGNILDESQVDQAIKGCDYVYNFAGIADIGEASEKPIESVKNNILGNTFILNSCKEHKIKRFVFASTVYVYSQSGSFYRATKQACETLIEEYQRKYDLPYTILRYGSLYGQRSPETNWIHKIIKEALTKGRITRHGDGEEIREYIHVVDAAELSVKILSEKYVNRIMTITGNKSMRIKDLHLMIKEMLNGGITLEFLPSVSTSHYEITPYNFNPRVAKKLVSNEYYDLGQGILELLSEIKNEIDKK